MKILVTGANGFVGKNLCATLKNIADGKDTAHNITSDITVLPYDLGTDPSLLDDYCRECDFVVHLAGVSHPETEEDFMSGNFDFTLAVLDTLKKHNNNCPVLMSSSVESELDNPYGRSKKAGEELMFNYAKETDVKIMVYRLPDLFGKWCRPNYNSIVATFCYNIARDLPITVNNRDINMTLVYVDDLVDEIIEAIIGNENCEGAFCKVPTEYKITLGEIADLIYSFKDSRETRLVPDMADGFTKKLYATYLSYIPQGSFSYPLKMNVDDRGSVTEFLRTADRGQISINVLKLGIVKGNHWHNTKNEKFLVVSGKGVVRLRKYDSDEITEYFVSGDKLEVVDIPVGYIHNIENLGDTDMVTLTWCNECFDPERPDTILEDI